MHLSVRAGTSSGITCHAHWGKDYTGAPLQHVLINTFSTGFYSVLERAIGTNFAPLERAACDLRDNTYTSRNGYSIAKL